MPCQAGEAGGTSPVLRAEDPRVPRDSRPPAFGAGPGGRGADLLIDDRAPDLAGSAFGELGVSLWRVTGDGNCVATTVGPRTIATAAHCVGTRNEVKGQRSADPADERRFVCRRPRHHRAPQSDVALCSLKAAAPEEVLPKPAGGYETLDARHTGPVPAHLHFAGFKSTSSAPTAGIVRLQVQSSTDETFLAENLAAGLCSGDSGGPGLHEQGNGQWTVVGVVSQNVCSGGGQVWATRWSAPRARALIAAYLKLHPICVLLDGTPGPGAAAGCRVGP